MIFRRAMLCIAALALAAPWLFFASISLGAASLWGSAEAARAGAIQITRALLYASMILVPVAAAAYGAAAPRRRMLRGVLGFVVGAALWLASLWLGSVIL